MTAINSASYDSTEHDAIYQHFQHTRYQHTILHCIQLSMNHLNKFCQHASLTHPFYMSYLSHSLNPTSHPIAHPLARPPNPLNPSSQSTLSTSEPPVSVTTASGSFHPGNASATGPSLMSSHVTVTHIPHAYSSSFHSNAATNNNNNNSNNINTKTPRKQKNSQGYYDTSATQGQEDSSLLNSEGGSGEDPRGGTLKEENIFQRQLLRKMMFHSTAQGVRNGKAILHQVHRQYINSMQACSL